MEKIILSCNDLRPDTINVESGIIGPEFSVNILRLLADEPLKILRHLSHLESTYHKNLTKILLMLKSLLTLISYRLLINQTL